MEAMLLFADAVRAVSHTPPCVMTGNFAGAGAGRRLGLHCPPAAQMRPQAGRAGLASGSPSRRRADRSFGLLGSSCGAAALRLLQSRQEQHRDCRTAGRALCRLRSAAVAKQPECPGRKRHSDHPAQAAATWCNYSKPLGATIRNRAAAAPTEAGWAFTAGRRLPAGPGTGPAGPSATRRLRRQPGPVPPDSDSARDSESATPSRTPRRTGGPGAYKGLIAQLAELPVGL